jgi:hypothetical protein
MGSLSILAYSMAELASVNLWMFWKGLMQAFKRRNKLNATPSLM